MQRSIGVPVIRPTLLHPGVPVARPVLAQQTPQNPQQHETQHHEISSSADTSVIAIEETAMDIEEIDVFSADDEESANIAPVASVDNRGEIEVIQISSDEEPKPVASTSTSNPPVPKLPTQSDSPNLNLKMITYQPSCSHTCHSHSPGGTAYYNDDYNYAPDSVDDDSFEEQVWHPPMVIGNRLDRSLEMAQHGYPFLARSESRHGYFTWVKAYAHWPMVYADPAPVNKDEQEEAMDADIEQAEEEEPEELPAIKEEAPDDSDLGEQVLDETDYDYDFAWGVNNSELDNSADFDQAIFDQTTMNLENVVDESYEYTDRGWERVYANPNVPETENLENFVQESSTLTSEEMIQAQIRNSANRLVEGLLFDIDRSVVNILDTHTRPIRNENETDQREADEFLTELLNVVPNDTTNNGTEQVDNSTSGYPYVDNQNNIGVTNGLLVIDSSNDELIPETPEINWRAITRPYSWNPWRRADDIIDSSSSEYPLPDLDSEFELEIEVDSNSDNAEPQQPDDSMDSENHYRFPQHGQTAPTKAPFMVYRDHPETETEENEEASVIPETDAESEFASTSASSSFDSTSSYSYIPSQAFYNSNVDLNNSNAEDYNADDSCAQDEKDNFDPENNN